MMPRVGKRLLILAGCILALTGCTRTVVIQATSAPSPSASPSSLSTPSAIPTTSFAPPPPLYDTPTLSEFSASLKTLSRQCFGDIGCNYTLPWRRNSMPAVPPAPFPPRSQAPDRPDAPQKTGWRLRWILVLALGLAAAALIADAVLQHLAR